VSPRQPVTQSNGRVSRGLHPGVTQGRCTQFADNEWSQGRVCDVQLVSEARAGNAARRPGGALAPAGCTGGWPVCQTLPQTLPGRVCGIRSESLHQRALTCNCCSSWWLAACIFGRKSCSRPSTANLGRGTDGVFREGVEQSGCAVRPQSPVREPAVVKGRDAKAAGRGRAPASGKGCHCQVCSTARAKQLMAISNAHCFPAHRRCEARPICWAAQVAS
jgi:hypothetical protein